MSRQRENRFPATTNQKTEREEMNMKINQFKEGGKVTRKGNKIVIGTILILFNNRAIVTWEDGGDTLSLLSDLIPVE